MKTMLLASAAVGIMIAGLILVFEKSLKTSRTSKALKSGTRKKPGEANETERNPIYTMG